MRDNYKEVETSEMKEFANKLFSAIPRIEHAKSPKVLDADGLSEHDFQTKFIDKNTPCLIKGAIKHWPAIEKWKTKEYWLSACENKQATFFNKMNFYDHNRKMKNSVCLPFHEAIERLFKKEDHTFSIPSQYIGKNTFFSNADDDATGFSFLSKTPKPLWDPGNFLFIYRRAASAWHVHFCDETIMCQVNGIKLVALIPPDIPEASYVTDFLQKELYLDGQKIDENLDLNPMLVEVREGDGLYIPPGWFHCVVPKDAEIGFTYTYNFRSPFHINGNLSNFFTRMLYKNAWKEPSIKAKIITPLYLMIAMGSYYLKKIGQLCQFNII